jgi:hypothetical protein
MPAKGTHSRTPGLRSAGLHFGGRDENFSSTRLAILSPIELSAISDFALGIGVVNAVAQGILAILETIVGCSPPERVDAHEIHHLLHVPKFTTARQFILKSFINSMRPFSFLKLDRSYQREITGICSVECNTLLSSHAFDTVSSPFKIGDPTNHVILISEKLRQVHDLRDCKVSD